MQKPFTKITIIVNIHEKICSSFLPLANPVLVHGVHESPYEDVQDWSMALGMALAAQPL